MHEPARQVGELPGLVQKYNGHKIETAKFTGIYSWDSEESVVNSRQSEPAKTIPVTYKAQGSPGIELLESLLQSRE